MCNNNTQLASVEKGCMLGFLVLKKFLGDAVLKATVGKNVVCRSPTM